MIRFTSKQWVYIVFVSIVLVLGAGMAFWLYSTRTQVDLTAFVVATLSAVISLVALFVSLQTYLSIDSVNNITKMEGNILDNENYVTSIPEFVDRYRQTESDELCAELLKDIKYNLSKHSNTAVNFADTIQGMIDVLVLLPALDLKVEMQKKGPRKDMEWILDRVGRRADELHSISKGSSIQIREAVKLFLAVYDYQNAVENRRLLGTSGLLRVRAAMIRNPVCATVYHNYLGLYYRKCAVQIVDPSDRADVPSIKEWEAKKKNISGDDMEKLRRYLDNSIDAFDKAWVCSSEDPMWRGYILFNQARVAFIDYMFFNVGEEPSFEKLQQAISARATLNELITEVLGEIDPPTVLQKHYLYQEEYARQLLVNYQIASGKKVTYRGDDIESREQYFDAIERHMEKLLPKNKAGLESLHIGLSF